jgi:hypothetical protein
MAFRISVSIWILLLAICSWQPSCRIQKLVMAFPFDVLQVPGFVFHNKQTRDSVRLVHRLSSMKLPDRGAGLDNVCGENIAVDSRTLETVRAILSSYIIRNGSPIPNLLYFRR